jgi:hypothetical protein
MTFHPANRLQDLCEVKRESVSARSASTGTRLSERIVAIVGLDYIRFSPLACPSPVATGRAFLQRAHRHTARFGLSGLVSILERIRKTAINQTRLSAQAAEGCESDLRLRCWNKEYRTEAYGLRRVKSLFSPYNFGAGRVMSQMGTPPVACRGSTLAGSIRQTRAKASYSPNAQPSPKTGRIVTDPSSFFTTERSRLIPRVAYPKCPVIAGFIIFAFCIPVTCLIVWLVYRGFAN